MYPKHEWVSGSGRFCRELSRIPSWTSHPLVTGFSRLPFGSVKHYWARRQKTCAGKMSYETSKCLVRELQAFDDRLIVLYDFVAPQSICFSIFRFAYLSIGSWSRDESDIGMKTNFYTNFSRVDRACLPASSNSFCTVYFSFKPELYRRAWHDTPDARLMSIYIYGVLENYWHFFPTDPPNNFLINILLQRDSERLNFFFTKFQSFQR